MNSKNHKVQIVTDSEAMSRAAAATIVDHISQSLQTRDVYSMALSGGSTPRRLYSLLANEAALREQIPWERIHFFWGDERRVPEGHPDSNYRMAYDALLSKVPIPSTNIHRIHAEDADAVKAAADYEIEMRRFFGIEAGQIPQFNCVLLGMGADGHIASLFPATSALVQTKRLVVANWVKKFQSHRFTLTFSVFNNAAQILFLVSGEDKADTLKAVLEGDSKTTRFPVQLIQPTHGEVTWFLDHSAASSLKPAD
jgi:6-phosphogluconolactonase